ncbi:hypothetical protein BKA57DRAFT_433807 [Linnemannia elongata]|nr:hypothetical protein BKA57DRAFT_433807 [Linnemannia elongata]
MAPLITLSACKRLSPPFQSTLWLWAILNFFSILLILPTTFVTALNPIPISVYAMAYASINEEKLIIQGGVDYQTPTLTPNVNQLMFLDLTLPFWDVTSPPWSYIPIGVPIPANLTTAFHSMSVSSDRNSFMIWDPNSPGSLTSFDMSKETWTPLVVPAGFQISEKGLKAATNPLTGKVYIPLGDRKMLMLVWDPVTTSFGAGAAALGPTPSVAAPDGTLPSGAGTVSSELMPDAVKEGMIGYTWTWCPSRKTFILFGGIPGTDPTAPYLHEFQPKGSKWTVMNTTGSVPPRMTGSCMEPAYKGTKMILFGGKGADQVSTGSIYILDLPTMVWSQGPNLDAMQNRSHMACAVAGDSFVVFGGVRRTDPNTIFKVDPTPLVYNINSNMWVSRFDRGSHYIEPSQTSTKSTKPAQPTDTSPSVHSTSSGLSGGAIAGIVTVGLVIIGAIIFFLIRKRNSQRQAALDDAERGQQGGNPQYEGPSSSEDAIVSVNDGRLEGPGTGRGDDTSYMAEIRPAAD